MKNVFILVITLILILAFTGINTAQKIELTPPMKAWAPVLGIWSGTGESKDSPTGTWTKHSVELEIRSRGFYVENRSKLAHGGKEILGIEAIGYDPVKKCYINTFFRDDGSWGSVTSMGWNDTTLNFNSMNTTADSKVQIVRGSWEFSEDFKSAKGFNEIFTDGKWWNNWRGEITRIE